LIHFYKRGLGKPSGEEEAPTRIKDRSTWALCQLCLAVKGRKGVQKTKN